MNRIAFLSLCALIFVIPWQQMAIYPGLGTMARLTGYIALGAAVLAVLAKGFIRRPAPIVLITAVLTLYGSMSLAWTITPESTNLTFITLVALFLFLTMLWESGDSTKRQLWLLQAYLFGCALSTSMLFTEFLVGGRASVSRMARFTGGGMNANEIALMLAIAIPIAAYLASHPLIRNPILKAVYWGCIPAAALAIFLTGSRAGAVAGGVAMGLTLLMSWRQSWAARVMLIAMVVCGVVAVVRYTPEELFERIALGVTGENISRARGSRIALWEGAVDIFSDHPMLGAGLGSFRRASELEGGVGNVAHSLFFQTLAELGMVGVVIWIAILLATFRSVWLMRKTPACLPWLAVLAAWGVGALTIDALNLKITWFVLAMVALQGESCRYSGPVLFRQTFRLPANQRRLLRTDGVATFGYPKRLR